MANTLRLRVFGRADLESGQTLIRLRTRPTLLVLFLLAETPGKAWDRRRLAGMVWPESDLKAARESLRTALTELRRLLADGALISDKQTVALKPGAVEVPDLAQVNFRDYEGDFLPGFDQEWVIDRRIELRRTASDAALNEAQLAWNSGDSTNAIHLAERARNIDPWHQEASAMCAKWLAESGDASQAIQVDIAYRTKMLRDLGILVERETVPIAQPSDHPLLHTARWLVNSRPEDATSFLASTHDYWPQMPVEPSLEFHEIALNTNGGTEREQALVLAQWAMLKVLQGKLHGHSKRVSMALEKAEREGEWDLASRLSGALSYHFLSRGDFRRSLSMARRSVAFSRQTDNYALQAEQEVDFGIIVGQLGQAERSAEIHKAAEQKYIYYCTPMRIAGYYVVTIDPLLSAGRIDQAEATIRKVRRIYESVGGGRSWQWMLFAEALVQERAGEFAAAKKTLLEICEIGREIGGQAVIAMSQECLARIDIAMREYVSAAEAIGRASSIRKSLGTVPSVLERTSLRQVKQILSQHLDARDLRAAYARAAASA